MIIYKYKFLFKTIVFLIIATFTGCVTTKVDYVENDKLPKDKVYRIAEVFMKDGTVINLWDTEPKFRAKYKGLTNVITYYDVNYAVRIIDLKDIKQIKIEILESNQIVTALIIVGVVAASIFFLLLIALGIQGIGPGKY
jgi:hypothetical protein